MAIPAIRRGLDVWIERTPQNAIRLVKALEQFGFGSLGLKEEYFLGPDRILQLGHPPSRIDLLTDPTGVDFAGCHGSRLELEMEGVTVAFIGLEGLRRNKKATGRTQNLADPENLQ